MTRPLRVFLCHSSNDKPTVRELYQKLRAVTWIEPWLDDEELYPGQDWNIEIEKAYGDYFEGQRERAFQRLLLSLKRRADELGLIIEEMKEEPKKKIPAKPYIKVLDPSSLYPNGTSTHRAESKM